MWEGKTNRIPKDVDEQQQQHSSMKLHSAYMQVHSGPLEGAPRQPWGMEKPQGRTTGVGNTYLWHLMGMEHNIHNAWMMGVYGGHCGKIFWHTREAMHTIAERLAEEGRMVVVVCRCTWLCKCKPLHQNSNGDNNPSWQNVGSTCWQS